MPDRLSKVTQTEIENHIFTIRALHVNLQSQFATAPDPANLQSQTIIRL